MPHVYRRVEARSGFDARANERTEEMHLKQKLAPLAALGAWRARRAEVRHV